MDRSRSDYQSADTQPPQTPAIGIDAVTSDAPVDALIHTVENVAHHDTPVLVVAPPDSPGLQRRLEGTPATLIELPDPGTDPTHALAAAGKDRGLPGVVVHPNPGDAVFDYEESIQTFQTSTQYVIDGHTTDPAADTSQLGILLAPDHDPATIAQLHTAAAPYLDELLIVTDPESPTGLNDPDTATPALPIESVPADDRSTVTPIVTALATVTRQYAHCDVITLLGADTPTVTDSMAVLPELVEPITDGDADLVVGRRVDAARNPDSTGSRRHLKNIVRNALSGDDPPRSDAELDDGPIAFTPQTARELERRLDQTATRLGIINTAIRADLTVRSHEYTPSESVDTEATNHGPSATRPAGQITDPEIPAEPGTSTSPAPTHGIPRSPQSKYDDRTRPAQRALERSLEIVYVTGADTSDHEVSLETFRDAVTALAANTELTVTDTQTSILEHVTSAHQHDTESFLVTPQKRSRDIDAIANTFGLGILPLPTAAPSAETLADTLRQHLDQHPTSQVIVAPGALTTGPDTTRIVAPSPSADSEGSPTTQHSGDVLVGIPAYNEAGSIADVVTDAAQYADDVIVVDDASDDDTAATASAAGATVIQHDENRGYGGALNTVFTEAARRDPAHLVVLDGDGQHDPSDIPDAVAMQEEAAADIVIGSRFETGSATDLPAYRRVGLAVVNTLTNLSMGVIRRESWVNDTQSGFRTYNRRAIRSLHHDDTIGEGMSASTDILYHAHQHDYDLEEIGTTIDYDVEDPSSHNPITHGLTLVANILKTIEHDRPVTSLGVPGFLSAFAGLGFGYWTFSNYIATGNFPLGLAVTSSFFGLAGIFACFTAIILHSLNTHLHDA